MTKDMVEKDQEMHKMDQAGLNTMFNVKIKTMITYVLSSLFFLIGILMAFFGITINGRVGKVIENTSNAIAMGEDIGTIKGPIMGILANGYLVNVPYSVALFFALSGVLIAYFSIYVILFTKNKLPLRSLFTKKYWLNFYFGVKG